MEDSSSSNVMLYDGLALKHGGMFATNGHSLYKSRDVIMDCLAQILKRSNASHPLITIADIATADGSTSLELLNDIIDTIHKRNGKSQQILLYYTDLPNNDFNRMFNVIQAGLNLCPNVFCAAVGHTMFEQCLPDKAADLMFSSIAVMNLSKRLPRSEDGQGSIEEMIKAQAALDWKSFLVMRGRELRPGGYLVVLSIGTTKQGDVTVQISGGVSSFRHVLRTLMTDDLITKDEFLDCSVLPQVYRTEADHALPFEENDKDVLETGLELVSIRSFVNKLNHPSFEVSDKDDATKKAYADRIIAGIKTWQYGFIYDGLSHNRSQEERESLVGVYFSRLWDFAYKNSNEIPQIALVEVVARKRA
ncbi:gibberellic acid methyltransferase 1-like [Pecten maximus]|uniref:gibberellic acid methyltransferase 1-like n=1 Tax=Pecten maximus TaxID=6579 RepID=UPI001458E1B8|nr:gibberellic acid methyltransferase 1-like [Pecten maximus]